MQFVAFDVFGSGMCLGSKSPVPCGIDVEVEAKEPRIVDLFAAEAKTEIAG